MQKSNKLVDQAVRLVFCLLFANAFIMTVNSTLLNAVSTAGLIFCTSLATTVFFIVYGYGTKRVSKIFFISVVGLMLVGIIGYLIASFVGAVKGVDSVFQSFIDLILGYTKLTTGQESALIYGAAVLISLFTVLLIGKRIIFSVVSASVLVCFFAQYLTGNIVSDETFGITVFLIYVTVIIGVYHAFEKFENRSGGAAFGNKRLWSIAVSGTVCLAVAIVSAVAPFEGASFVKKIDLQKLSNSAYADNGEGEFFLAGIGMGSDDAYLGGSTAPNYDPALELTSDYPVYLVGNYQNNYTGHGWTTGDMQKTRVEEVTADIDTMMKTEAFELAGLSYSVNNITIKNLDMEFRNLFQTNDLFEMEKPNGRTMWTDFLGNKFTNQYVRNGFTYSFKSYYFDPQTVMDYLRSDAYTGGLSEKSKLNPALVQEELISVKNKYTNLPDSTPERVGELAQEIVARSGAEKQIDKVWALMEYMYQFPYTYGTGDLPKGRDFVDYFLFDEQKGYCTYFASALCVMARTLGMPARYVEGFCPQEEAGESVYIDNSSAHAWTDIYFEGFGWVTFEPTPYNASYYYNINLEDYREKEENTSSESVSSSILDNNSSNANSLILESEEEYTVSDPEPVESVEPLVPENDTIADKKLIDNGNGFSITVGDILNVLLALCILAAVILVPVLIVRGRKKQMMRLNGYDNRRFTIAVWREIVRLMKFIDMPMDTGETVREYMQRLSAEFGDDVIAASADSFERALYSHQSLSDNDRAYAAAAYDLLNSGVKARKNRLWFNLNRYLFHRI